MKELLVKCLKLYGSFLFKLSNCFLRLIRSAFNCPNKKTKNTTVKIKNRLSFIPADIKKYFNEDELCEIEYFAECENDHFENSYDITDEWYQDFFKKAKNNNFELTYKDDKHKYSILKKDNKYYLASVSGCSCKVFKKEGFCQHMVLNAINHNLIDSITGIKTDDKALQEKYNFTLENIIDSFYSISKIKEGLVKYDESIKYFSKKGLIEVKTEIEDFINYLGMKKLRGLIPDLKEKLKEIDPNIKISYIPWEDLSKAIIDNKNIFQRYFDNLCFVLIDEKIQDKIYDSEELIDWVTFTQKHYK